MGQGTVLAKMDLKEAYRSIPVHPADRPLLAVRWQGITFVDGALPFGLRSAPKLFSAVADGLLWIFFKGGVQLAIHYLDDFLFLGPPHGPGCSQSLQKALHLCEELGVPVAPDKTEGPATSIIFLGIEIDTQAGQLRLPREKLADLIATLQSWMRPDRLHIPKHSGTKRDLLSLIGKLHHASRVIKPGRAFIRSLIDTSIAVTSLDHHVSLKASWNHPAGISSSTLHYQQCGTCYQGILCHCPATLPFLLWRGGSKALHTRSNLWSNMLLATLFQATCC